MGESFLNGRVLLHPGNCLDVLARLDECSIDSCVCDPPYHLTSIVQRFGAENAAPARVSRPYGGGFTEANGGTGAAFARMSRGFMGKVWDGGTVAFEPATWRAVIRVLKPGGHLIACGGTRTYHRMACAIEDAGFEIRDTISWLYGSGFPKSHDVSKGIDRAAGVQREVVGFDKTKWRDASNYQGEKYSEMSASHYESKATITAPATDAARQWEGWGTALKPACELIVLARKPLGTGDIDVQRNVEQGIRKCGHQGDIIWIAPDAENAESKRTIKPEQSLTQNSGDLDSHPAIESFAGIATGLTGSMERVHIKHNGNSFVWPMNLPRFIPSKPLNVAANVLRWGTGAINVDGCRVGNGDDRISGGLDGKKSDATIAMGGSWSGERFARPTGGRWPANVVHDGSDEVVAAFPETNDSPSGIITQGGDHFSIGSTEKTRGTKFQGHGDTDTAARFFYTAKADADDRLGSKHPTVKPLDLMQWLVRLVCPKGGVVLDPFAGTGTTGEAAWREGCAAVLIEAEPEYQADIRRRMALVLAGPDERTRESIKAKNLPVDYGPLFGFRAEAAE